MNSIGPATDYLFIISSAIHTARGIYSSEERMDQTLMTMRSIQEKVPTAKMIIVDASTTSLTDEETALLQSKGVYTVIKFDNNSPIIELSRHNRNSAAEVQSMMSALSVLKTHEKLQQLLTSTKRIFKISGRYQLNSNFHITDYNNRGWFGKYIFLNQLPTWMNPKVNGAEFLYVTRLWSMCPSLIDNYLEAGPNIFNSIMRDGLDLEHATFKHTIPDLIMTVPLIGVSGHIATNGALQHD